MAINLRKTVNKDKLKAKFEAEASGGNQGGSDFLPYFKLKNKDTVVLRFLSDANPNNQDFFTYTENVYNFNGKNMKFDGADKECPSAKIAADLFAEAKSLGEESEEGKAVRERALKFYKKKKYLANCYIVEAPEYFWAEAGLDADKIEDRVKVVSLPKKVYEAIKDTVMDSDYDDLEFYNFGDDVVNFKLTVKKNSGGFNDYSASKFESKPKELDVTDDEVDVIAENLKDLSTLFKVHSLEEFNEAIEIEMNGGDEDEDDAPKVKKAKSKPAPVEEDDEDEEEEAPKPKAKSKPAPVEEDDEYEEEEAPKPKAKSKPAPVEEDDEYEEEEAPKPKAKSKPAPVEEDDEDEEEDDEPKKDIKSLRKGILSKLKIQDEDDED